MPLFTHYIEPLSVWLYAHPYWALVFIFLISMLESLVMIGNMIPGSVAMTAIGIFAGSGIIRIDLTLIAATLGAIVGDGSSYLIGYTFSDRLMSIWPFRRYPKWIQYGKTYFQRQGAKSVFIGRFVGPLRPIIPVIAGIMHMSHWRFFIANTLSAVAWALLYILPGVLIGKASSELSPETATNLFVLILTVLVALWVLSIGINWLIKKINALLHSKLHRFWSKAMHHSFWRRILKPITPINEQDHTHTVILFTLFGLSTFLLIAVTVFLCQQTWIYTINYSSYLFLQSLQTHVFEVFFILIDQIMSPMTLTVLFLFISLAALYYKDWRSLTYWTSLNLFCALSVAIFHQLVNNPRPQGIIEIQTGSSFPIAGLTFATALFTTLIFYVNSHCTENFNRGFKLILASSLVLAGVAPIYLGDHWISDSLGSYFLGFSLCLFFWIFYRRYEPKIKNNFSAPILILSLLLISSALAFLLNYPRSLRAHQPYLAQYVFTDQIWWNQKKSILPLYNSNRIGRRVGLFNIQYAGSLSHLEQALAQIGWQKQNYSLFNSMLLRVSGQSSIRTQFYLSRPPKLVMSYQPSNGYPRQILQIWRSNYHLQHVHQPIWLGTVQSLPLRNKNRNGLSRSSFSARHMLPTKKKQIKTMELLLCAPDDGKTISKNHTQEQKMLKSSCLSKISSEFSMRVVHLPQKVVKLLPLNVEPILILMRESTLINNE